VPAYPDLTGCRFGSDNRIQSFAINKPPG
jgi:hypothetical protein